MFPALRASWQSSMRWLVSTELRNKVLSGSPARASRVCMVADRRARMGSTRGKSLSASSWECCPHCLHTSARVVSERGLGGTTTQSLSSF